MVLFNTFLEAKKPILIAVRDISQNSKNPIKANDVKELWNTVYLDNPLAKIIIIPDIESVNYGRSFGYDINEIKVETIVSNISATEIRNQISTGKTEWKAFID